MKSWTRYLAAATASVAAVAGAIGGFAPPTEATQNASSQQPIEVGFINQEEGATTYVGTGDGTRAAIKYINAQGGVGGRKIDLVQCLDDGTPQVTAACASQLVSKGVSVVLDGANLSDGAAHSILTSAGIPVVGGFPFTSDDTASKTSFWMFPDPDLLAGGVKLMASTFKAQTIAYLMPDVAAAQGPTNVMAAEAKKLKVSFKVADYSLTSTDFSAPIAQLILAHPQVMLTFTTDSAAASVVSQFRTAGWTGPIVVGTSTAYVSASDPSAAKGVYAISDLYDWFTTSGVPSRDVSNIKVFKSAMKRYEPQEALGSYAQQGFATTMDLAEVLQGLGATHINSKAIITAFQKNVNRPKFMGTTFNCGANSIPSIPGNCAKGIQFVYWTGSSWRETQDFVSASS